MFREQTGPVFVGRKEVFDLVLDNARGTLAGPGRTTLALGSPGCGKTASLRELQRRSEQERRCRHAKRPDAGGHPRGRPQAALALDAIPADESTSTREAGFNLCAKSGFKRGELGAVNYATLRDALAGVCKAQDRSMVFAVDEIQRLAAATGADAQTNRLVEDLHDGIDGIPATCPARG